MEYKHNKKLVPIARVLRKNMTKEERRLWYDFLKDYPLRFVRQKVLGKYIADFYCAEANLIVEIDGAGHDSEEGKRKDAERTAYLEGYGLKVIRFSNHEINKDFIRVCEGIDRTIRQKEDPTAQETNLERRNL